MTVDSLLGPELAVRLESYRLAVCDAAAAARSGPHPSRSLGRGFEFVDYRDYREGDDLQRLDWRAMARLNRLVVRLAYEERERPLYLFVDGSASMNFGAPSKFHLACRISTALAHVALINQDRVHIHVATDGHVHRLGPLCGRSQSHSVRSFFNSLRPAGSIALNEVIARYADRHATPGLLVLISDYLSESALEFSLQRLHRQRHDVLALHLVCLEDRSIPEGGELVFVDSEERTPTRLSLSSAIARSYREAFTTYAHNLEANFSCRGFRYVRLDVDQATEDVWLRRLIEARVLI